MIDYNKLTAALQHYQSLGYKLIEVPWIVSDEADSATRPNYKLPIRASTQMAVLGNLVASAEQGFIEMMIQGKLSLGKYVAITPCFRDEVIYDEIHFPYFMKVELIHVGTSDNKIVQEVIEDALAFFDKYVKTEIERTKVGFDIVAKGIELGSYGAGKYDNHVWVYGTGCAEPRLSQILKLK